MRITLAGIVGGGLLVVTGVVAGCNIVGPAFYLVHGPEKTKRLYELDAKRATVVFVDDRGNRVPRRSLRLMIAQEAEKTLLKGKALEDMISADSAMAAAGNDRSDRPAPITEIGRALKADVVIYATVDQFDLSPDGATYAPAAVLRVKVIDAANDTRLWPADAAGHPLTVRMTARSRDIPTGTAARYTAEEELAKQAGMELANLFITHETPRGATVPQ
ncbi:MAG: hypothetical protein WD749_09680 [Phycisphaerales bacterium]